MPLGSGIPKQLRAWGSISRNTPYALYKSIFIFNKCICNCYAHFIIMRGIVLINDNKPLLFLFEINFTNYFLIICCAI
jgi:hypothetical protein